MIATQGQQEEAQMTPTRRRFTRLRKIVIEEFQDMLSRLPKEVADAVPPQPFIMYLANKYEMCDDTIRKYLCQEKIINQQFTRRRSNGKNSTSIDND